MYPHNLLLFPHQQVMYRRAIKIELILKFSKSPDKKKKKKFKHSFLCTDQGLPNGTKLRLI